MILAFILLLCSTLHADDNFQFAPLFSVHDSQRKVDEEFRNVAENLQSQQFYVFSSTPVLSTVKDGSIFIVYGGSSTIYSALMWRRGNEIYKVNGSCITVIR